MLAFSALADGDPATDNVPRLIPYQGTLESDGQPVHAVGPNALDIRFALFDGPEATEPVYIQDMTVEVFSGRFTATIGPTDIHGVSVQEVVAAADDLYLGLTFLNNVEDPEDDMVLSNRQRIHATPYAMWSSTATNLTVANRLTVGGALNVGGSLRVADTVHMGSGKPVSGKAQVQLDNNASQGAPDDFNDFQLLLHQNDSPANSHGIGVENNGTLFMNTREDVAFYRQGVRRMHLDNNTLHVGNIEASGTISGNLQFARTLFTISRHNNGGRSNRSMGSTNRRFCFLTRVGSRDLDGGDEFGACTVTANNNQWNLEARLDNTGDADIYCSAMCLTF
ncbi:MAG: hypothetical protein AAFS10_22580 [Myxococcota bacterium]